VTGALSPQTWWWFSRATGLVAWAVITASVVWGLTLSSRLVRRRGIPAWLLDLHRYLGTLAFVFTGLHLASLVADSYVHFGTRELFVPMASTWRPGPVAWGIVAFYVLVVIQVSSWVMRRIPRRLWHAVHSSSFVLFVAGTFHAATAGTDRVNRLVQSSGLAGATLVVFLTAFRLLSRRTPAPAAVATIPRAPSADAATAAADDRAARLAALAARGRTRSAN
jgi:DMSO/TMAO reductase YedYZ heme-binding membrane subunit